MTMLLRFLFANVHFILTIFSAFVFFTTGLLYLDSRSVKKSSRSPMWRAIGFFVLAFSAVGYAITLEPGPLLLGAQTVKIIGLIIIWASLLKEPILHPPKTMSARAIIPFAAIPLFFALEPIAAILMLIIAITYLRHAQEGYEKQLLPVSIAFFVLAFSELLSVSFYLKDTTNIFLSRLLADYGPVWAVTHLVTLVGALLLFKWAFGYIRFRLQSELFVLSVCGSLLIFLITTALFTFLLLRNLEHDALSHLNTDVKVLQYALERQQMEALANSKTITQDSAFKKAFLEGNYSQLYKISSEYMVTQKTSFLDTADKRGQVVMRATDRERVGDYVVGDAVFDSASTKQPLATVVARDAAFIPTVEIRAAAPIRDEGVTKGVVITGFVVDNAFVDGVKDITGLDAALFAKNKRVATTFVAPDGKSRYVGTLESNGKVLKTVLGNGETFLAASDILNQPFYTAYAPLKTNGDKVIGMLFVGKPQTALYGVANRSLELTFLGSAVLIMLSLIPTYFISRYLHEQMTA